LLGFLCAEDVMQALLDDIDTSTLTIDDLLRPAACVPSTVKVDDMFDYFQSNDLQAVILINEFGSVDGLLTRNDVLTCIFGRLPAESEQDRITYDSDSGVYEVPGDLKLIDINRLTNFGLQDPRMTTIGGVILRRLGRVPIAGDQVSVNGTALQVQAMEGNRITRVRASRGKEPAGMDK
jgi:CBS domain containing-hemolysin-like protein